MPLAYPTGTLAEHMACRTDAVAFDVSHLGTVRVAGAGRIRPPAARAEQRPAQGGARAGPVHPPPRRRRRLGPRRHHRVVVGRGRLRRHAQRLEHRPGARRDRRRRHHRRRGPSSPCRAPRRAGGSRRSPPRPPPSARFAVTRFAWHGAELHGGRHRLHRRGRRRVRRARRRWPRRSGRPCSTPASCRPASGARDTLRLEAGLPLHGHELGPGITPLQAGLGWVVGWDKGDFRGRAALERERGRGPAPRVCGASWPRAASHRATAPPCWPATAPVGTVTSGNFSPVLGGGSPWPSSTPLADVATATSSPSTSGAGASPPASVALPVRSGRAGRRHARRDASMSGYTPAHRGRRRVDARLPRALVARRAVRGRARGAAARRRPRPRPRGCPSPTSSPTWRTSPRRTGRAGATWCASPVAAPTTTRSRR